MAAGVEALLIRSRLGVGATTCVPLHQGFWIVPIARDTPRPKSRPTELADLLDITGKTVALAERLSSFGPALYVHFEYHGGTGFQGAAIWENSSVSLGPVLTANHENERQTTNYVVPAEAADQAINLCLRRLGVERRKSVDEFSAVGLDRYRFTDDWLATTPYPCVVCGGLVFDEPVGSYGICPVCGWEDDPVQARHPRMSGGANGASVADYQNAAAGWYFLECDREQDWRPLRPEEAALDGGATSAVDYDLDFYKGRPPYYWRL